MQQSLSYYSLGELDGGAARAVIDAAIREALADLDDRGADNLPRCVDIRLTLKQLDNGLVETHLEARAVLPQRRTASTIARLQRDAQQTRLLFQTGAPDNPDQRTFDETEKE